MDIGQLGCHAQLGVFAAAESMPTATGNQEGGLDASIAELLEKKMSCTASGHSCPVK